MFQKMSDKSYVGMGHSVCPVCCVEHSEVVLFDRRMRDTLTRKEFMGLELCTKCDGLKNDGYVALVEVTNHPRTFADAKRTGNVAHVKEEAFKRIFGNTPPHHRVSFVSDGTIKRLQSMTEEPATV